MQGKRRVDDAHAAGRQPRAFDAAIGQGLQLARFDGERGVQPVFARLGGQGLQALGQVVRLLAANDGVPHGIAAGGKAAQAVVDEGRHLGVIGLHFIAGIAQQQAPAVGWRQKFFGIGKAVFHQDLGLPALQQLLGIAQQGAGILRHQLKQAQLVLRAQHLQQQRR